jgi:hypothetical protein
MNDCANTAALETYLRNLGKDERRLDAISARSAHLMATDCSPSRTGMVLEAAHEMSETVADRIAIELGHIANKRCATDKASHYEMIGRLFAGFLENYCAKEAGRIAEDEINNAACVKCFDAGCRHCRERED